MGGRVYYVECKKGTYEKQCRLKNSSFSNLPGCSITTRKLCHQPNKSETHAKLTFRLTRAIDWLKRRVSRFSNWKLTHTPKTTRDDTLQSPVRRSGDAESTAVGIAGLDGPE